MCVTNFVKRKPRPVIVAANPVVVLSKQPSLISQRLHGNFLPLLASTPIAKPATEAAVYKNIFYSASSSHYPIHASSNGCEMPKAKPKRRRKPQKPGLTAKMNERHFVKHDYHDHAFDADESDVDEDQHHNQPCNAAQTFPMKLYSVLERVEADGLSHIVSWQPHGRCFCIHKPKEFTDIVLPTYLRQGKLTSFQRQLNLYGYQRLTRGKDAGGYYHELFLRGKINLTKRMKRTKIKGTKFKAASSPEQEPDFYTMPPVSSMPNHVSDESSAGTDSYHNPRNDSHSTSIPSQLGSVLEFSSTARFEPTSLQVPRPQILHAPIQQYPMFSATAFNKNTPNMGVASVPSRSASAGDAAAAAMKRGNVEKRTSLSSTSFPLGFRSRSTPSGPADLLEADHILDDAVDELFKDTDAVPDGIANLDDLWDSSGFEEVGSVGVIENDLQLGNMLETFLEQF